MDGLKYCNDYIMLENDVKNVNIFRDTKLENFNKIETLYFDLQKFNISFMPKRGLFHKKY